MLPSEINPHANSKTLPTLGDGPRVECKLLAPSMHIADDGGVTETDRRRVPRRNVNGTALAVFDGNGTLGALVRVTMLDESLGGVGVLCPVPVEIGSRFSLIPESGIGLRQIGEVMNCVFTPEGYRLGLRNRTLRSVA
jgi:hypothetical protein